jgi:serpin B
MRSFFLRSLRTSLLVTTVPALALVACNGGSSSDDTGTAVSTSVQRDKSPQVTAADEATLVTGNTDFAFGLYHGLSSGDTTGNLFYSPYSVSLALAMTYAGATGSTATQMASALQFTLPASRLNPAFDKLDLAVQAKPAGAKGQDGQPFAVNVADSLWGDQSVTFQQGFVDTLAADYGASLRTVDFTDQPGQAEAAINTWVADATNDKIDPLLAPGTLTSDTRFVIVNAVYFNASWATTFEKTSTQTGPFTRADGSTVQTPLMVSDGTATAYAKGANWQAVELPYSGNTTSMVVVLPDTGAYAAVEKGLSGTFFAGVTAALAPSGVIELTLPSFKIHGSTISLAPQLQALGMSDAFDPSKANFTAMIPAGGTYIGDVLHQAFVDVDESGTEAAAATAVVGLGAAAPVPGVTVTVDHPFFFFIRDRASNTVLFVGREGDPTA